MARIYISSSWRNRYQPELVAALRRRGHEVYDFRHPKGRHDHNVWDGVSNRLGYGADYEAGNLTPEQFRQMLTDTEAAVRFKEHYSAMQAADTCILLLPCERSSHVEAGAMSMMGKRVFVMDMSQETKPELMYLMFNDYFYSLDDLYIAVDKPISDIDSFCGINDRSDAFKKRRFV